MTLGEGELVAGINRVSDQLGHGFLVQVDGVFPFGGKEDLLNLLRSDRNGLAFGIASQLGAKVWEVGDVKEGLGQANLHLHLSGIIFTNCLHCSVKVCVHDLNASLNQKNIINKGKAPEVVPGLGNSSDGSPMRAKVRVQWTNHRFFRPVGGQKIDDHDLLTRGAMGGGPFATGLCPLQVRGGNRSSTRHNLLGVNDGSSGCSQEGLGHLDKPCLSSGATLPLLGGRGLGEGNSGGSHC
jgi:hypothetical protein